MIEKFSKMKIIVVFALVSFVALANCQGQKSMILALDNYLETVGLQFRDECMKESKVDEAVLLKLEKGAELVNDEGLKCYLRCSYIKSNIINEKGIVIMENLKQAVKITNQELLKRLEQDCMHPKHDDPCEAAFLSLTCGLGLLEEFHIH